MGGRSKGRTLTQASVRTLSKQGWGERGESKKKATVNTAYTDQTLLSERILSNPNPDPAMTTSITLEHSKPFASVQSLATRYK